MATTTPLLSTRYASGGACLPLTLAGLRELAAAARGITIAAGFFDTAFILGLLEGLPPISLKIITNDSPGTRGRRERDALAKTCATLEEAGHAAKSRVVRQRGMFHSKIFSFTLRRGPAVCLIGSCNATIAALDANEEVMLCIAGESATGEVLRYLDHLWSAATAPQEVQEYVHRDLLSFFFDGVLWAKPATSRSLCFRPNFSD